MSRAMPLTVDAFRHEALFYQGGAEFLAGTVPFIKDGLAAGEPVLVVESAEKIKQVRDALGADADSVEFADMGRVGANPALIIPAWRDFVKQHGGGARRLRGIGEPIWAGRSEPELIECQRHESLLNVAFGEGRAWWLLCPYDTASLPALVIDEARRSHEFIAQGSTQRPSAEFRGLEGSAAPFNVPLPDPPAQHHELAFDGETLSEVRQLAGRFAAGCELDESKAADLVFAVNEVATNTVRHGGGSGWLRLWRDARNLTIEIRDAGRYDRPLADRERPGTDVTASRGLWLANQLCDLVQIRSFASGTVVRLHMHRPKAKEGGLEIAT